MDKEKQDYVDSEVKRLLSTLEYSPSSASPPLECHESQLELAKAIRRDMDCEAMIELLRVARFAREQDLKIPKKFSYFMIDYLTSKFDKTLESDIIEEASNFNSDDHALRGFIGIHMEIGFIVDGFEKGLKDVHASAKPSIDDNLDIFRNKRLRPPLSPQDYGYLLGLKHKRLTMEDTKMYFEVTLNKSDSYIGRLFTKYRVTKEDLKKKPRKRRDS